VRASAAKATAAATNGSGLGWLERADLSAGTTLELDVPASEELLVWAHRVTDDGDSLPLDLSLSTGAKEAPRLIELASGRATLAAQTDARTLTIRRVDGSGNAGKPEHGSEGTWAGLVKRQPASEATA
jgi:hypothetical protein